MYFAKSIPLVSSDGLLFAADGLLYATEQTGLITDRTRADVDRARRLAAIGIDAMSADEAAEWYSGPLGAYDATDMDRVGEAVRYLADLLTGYGYAVDAVAKQDWTASDAPSESELARYLADVSAVRSALTMQDNTPLLPDSMVGMTWIGANNIERVLAAVEDSIRRMEQSWFYFGEVYCGEV